jgi:hypothetical protein
MVASIRAKMKTELCVTMCLRFLQLVDLERVAHEQLVEYSFHITSMCGLGG